MSTGNDDLLYPLNDNSALIKLIANISGADEESVRARLCDEERHLGISVATGMRDLGITPHIWSDQLAEFYAKTDTFLYETSVWNRTPLKQEIRQWFGDYLQRDQQDSLKVLTYGDGLGFDAAYLAKRGHHVTYFEVSEDCIRFARDVFEGNDVSINMVTTTDDLSDASFDVVLCLDVLEHVPDPPATVANFARWLNPAGRLIASAPFFLISLDYSTHLKSSKRFAGDLRKLYKPSGFHLIGGKPFWDPIVLAKNSANITPWKSRLLERFLVRLGGLALATGRGWPGIHCAVTRLMSKRDPKWLRDLEAQK